MAYLEYQNMYLTLLYSYLRTFVYNQESCFMYVF
jgi:hypothetical protein